MTRSKKYLLLALGLVLAPAAFGFSLLGPYKSWEVTPIGYNLPGDIGGPMNPTEAYRWTTPTVTYGFDQSFLEYFGTNGVAAIDAAFKILNQLPPASKITNDGANIYINGEIVPTDVKRVNYDAQAVGLLDLKSTALSRILEELGLAEPERWVWALRGRDTMTVGGVIITNYITIQLNFDPITRKPTPYVNGVLYTFQIQDPIRPINYADAIEFEGDQLAFTYSSVAGQFVGAGEFYTGLSHDDVGALKFLLSPNNFANETLLTSVTGGGPLNLSGVTSPWVPFLGTTNFSATNFFSFTNLLVNVGTNATNNLIVQGLRPGVNKIKFQRVNYDSLLGSSFTPITNNYSDLVITNGRTLVQSVSRVMTQPDIVFQAYDLGLSPDLVPWFYRRTGTATWINNDAINGTAPQDGPGVIHGPITIAFTDLLPYYANTSDADGLGEDPLLKSFVWGSFDGTTKEPIIYPFYKELTLDDLRRPLFFGGGN